MTLECGRSIVYSKEMPWLHDDSNAKMLTMLVQSVTERWNQRTQWLLLQDEENGVQELQIFGQVVQLNIMSKGMQG